MRALAALLLAVSAASAGAAELTWVHVESNVGGASGGHSALRLGDDVYHFQARDDRLILARHPWRTFHFGYNVLNNRPLHLARLSVGDADLRRARDAFAATYLEQRRLLDQLAAARLDVALLEALAGERAGAPTRGAGLLAAERAGAPAGRALREHIGARLGPDFLSAAIASVEAELGAAAPTAGSAQELREKLSLRAALAALDGAYGLDSAAVVEPVDGPAASAAEREALAATADAFAETAVALLRSTRPDRGAALFTAAARHHAAWRSASGARLVFADPFPDDAPTLGRRETARRHEELAAVAERIGVRYVDARSALETGGSLGERRYQELEALAARSREYDRGARGAPVRESPETLAPQRSREVPLLLSAAAREAARSDLAVARARVLRLERTLDERHPYELLRANCVTELARILEESLGGPERARSVLGVGLDTDGPLDFVPFVFFRRFTGDVPPAELASLRSYRGRALAARPERSAWRRLREGNVVTSTLYRRRDADGSFVFFTDDAVAPRPLYGALNLAFAIADGTLGLLTAPFDRGARLVRAGRGALFSAPELAFVNIRKGSFDAASLRGAAPALVRPPP